jgi:hypothetical protein
MVGCKHCNKGIPKLLNISPEILPALAVMVDAFTLILNYTCITLQVTNSENTAVFFESQLVALGLGVFKLA